NRANFHLGRFLAFLVASVVWAGLMTMGLFFSVIFAAILTLNGQEWYQDRFGTEGRLGTGWKLWSDGGRAITILILFGFLSTTITGFAANPHEPPFGFGVDDRSFAFAEAETLRRSGVQGRVLNLLLSQGDALIWKDPAHKTYLDTRKGVFPDSLRHEHQQIQTALAKGDRATWAPMLDKYDITVVMVSPTQHSRIYDALRRSPFWVPFYDGGLAVLFGRVDKETPDQTVFLDRRLDAEKLAYGRNDPLPDPIRVPTPTGFLDRAFRSRAMDGPPPAVLAGQRWLANPVASPPQTEDTELPSPARAILAVRSARQALVKDPDDPYAYGLLQAAYAVLESAELNILNEALAKSQQDRPLTGTALRREISPLILELRAPVTAPERLYDPYRALSQRFVQKLLTDTSEADDEPSEPVRRPVDYLTFRYRQRVAALNLAIQTWPPPKSLSETSELVDLRMNLFQLYLNNQAFDLARDQLQAIRDLVGSDFPEAYSEQLEGLNQRIEA
ncbi:MAG TPA: hypothetical protein VFT74_11600, partial [Isosphaeraceae bacterium]|nr:hypothetical protein [Isosphaeraceae bacterium]